METTQKLEDINQLLDKDKYDNLDSFLRDFEWDLVGETILIPKNVRIFAKGIHDVEVRVDLLKFLHKYARQYFYDAAEHLSYRDKVNSISDPYIEKVKTPDEYIQRFQQEVAFLLDQIETAGEFSGDKFKKLQKRIEELEKKNEKLEEIRQTLINEVEILKAKIEELEHPERKHQIPNELQCEEFYHIITYLENMRIVTHRKGDAYYRSSICYHWNSTKALFGYFVCKICYLLELRTREDHLIWKPFKQAFENFGELEKQARDHASKNRNWENPSSAKPEDAYIVDDALKYSEEQMARSKARKKDRI